MEAGCKAERGHGQTENGLEVGFKESLKQLVSANPFFEMPRLNHLSGIVERHIDNVENSQERNGDRSEQRSQHEDQQALPPRGRFKKLLKCEPCIEHCHRKENQSYHSPSPYWVSLVHKVDTVVDVRSNVKQEKTKVWQKGTRMRKRRTRLNSPKTKVLMRVKGSLIAEIVVGIVTNITNKMSDSLDFMVNQSLY